MATSKQTTNYALPIYAPDDVTSYLVTWNGAMTLIDTTIANVQTEAEKAGEDIQLVEASVNQLTASVQQLNTSVEQNSNNIATNTSDISGVKSNVASIIKDVNNLDSKVTAVEQEVGAAYKGVMSATETKVTINVSGLTAESMIDVYTSTYGIVPNSVEADIANQLVKVGIDKQEDTSVYPLYVKVFIK